MSCQKKKKYEDRREGKQRNLDRSAAAVRRKKKKMALYYVNPGGEKGAFDHKTKRTQKTGRTEKEQRLVSRVVVRGKRGEEEGLIRLNLGERGGETNGSQRAKEGREAVLPVQKKRKRA